MKKALTAFFILLATVFFLDACTLFHQEQGNEAPILKFSQIDTTKVHRNGRITLNVLAADADDDELFYRWDALGAGTFTDPEASSTVWIAPEITASGSEFFLINVIIRDRICDIITDPQKYQDCEAAALASQVQQTFLVEVIQTPPTLQAPTDTLLSFANPVVKFSATGDDLDGDPLVFTWTQLEGASVQLTTTSIDATHSSLQFVPILPDDYLFAVQVSDGADSIAASFGVQIVPDPVPLGGSQVLSLTADNGLNVDYEIDIYEYPNQKGASPLVVNSFFAADAQCRAAGRRLCFIEEWLNACQGTQQQRYSSTDNPDDFEGDFGRRFCNQPGSAVAADDANPDNLAASGSFTNCFSDFGIYDMSGNAAEWVIDVDQNGGISGHIQPSSARNSSTCDTFNSLPTLPADFTFDDNAAIEALDALFYGGYNEQAGFRCCHSISR